jgi:hypothetical protein
MLATRSATVYEVRPFCPSDYVRVAALDGRQGDDLEQTASTFAMSGPARTLCIYGEPLACAGISIQWTGLGLAWAIVSSLALKHRRALHSSVKDGMREMIAAYGLRRVDALVMADFWVGRRWLQGLGFVEESLMPRYGPAGETMVRTVYFPEADP